METKQRDELIKGKRKQKKKRRFFRKLLIFISFIVIALAAFVITIKVTTPDFDFKTLIPKKAYTMVDEKLLGHTTTTTTTEAPAPTVTTASTKPLGHYLPQKEFKFDFDKKGSLVGSILNGGNAWHDNTYIYHLIPGYGVYRMFPGTEEDVRLLQNKDKLCCLNVSDSKLYFVNATDGNLYKLAKS
ncbi:MAG: hypothetical protein IJT65_07960, partial [Eubacterium sp.]|nr:hypothetical protein [Eubacterium sp.]